MFLYQLQAGHEACFPLAGRTCFVAHVPRESDSADVAKRCGMSPYPILFHQIFLGISKHFIIDFWGLNKVFGIKQNGVRFQICFEK